MKGLPDYSINVRGKLLPLDNPVVMGILNVTPDSFYSGSRMQTERDVEKRACDIVDEGGLIIDIGAYSSRPGADDVPVEEEMRRYRMALEVVRKAVPDAIVSVDTFRADVAKMCVEEYGADIVNDISGGELDENMFPTVASLGVPYILMHSKGNPRTMQTLTDYDNFLVDVNAFFDRKIKELRSLGAKDIILDPGFGFAKTVEQNYSLLNNLDLLKIFQLPILVGLSRKSMIYKVLGTNPENALTGTIAANTVALMKGASILRVHDVAQAVQTAEVVARTLV
jgi:dihydropteroate synthase